VSVVCCAGRGLFNVLIPRPGNPNRVVCVTRCNDNPLHMKWVGRKRSEEESKKELGEKQEEAVIMQE
jgi:hypothetical protein